MKNLSRFALIQEFNESPSDTLFRQKTVAAILDCSEGKLRQDRFGARGLPFIRIGRAVRYRKSDILAFIGKDALKFGTLKKKKTIHGTNNITGGVQQTCKQP